MAKLPLTEIEKPVKKSGKRVRRRGKRRRQILIAHKKIKKKKDGI